MKHLLKTVFFACFSLILFNSTSCKANQDNNIKSLKTRNQEVSYCMGMDMAKYSKQLNSEIDMNAFIQGFKDIIKESTPLVSEKEARVIMTEFSKELRENQQKNQQKNAKKNKEEGEKFLKENKTKKGVKTTKSGLQYKVLEKGKGKKPTAHDKVKVHYTGKLLDGKIFDSSVERGEPVSFPLKGVIKGWTEGLQLMNKGSKYRFFIPSDLAYGKNPRPGGPIGPNATLIFDVELIDIVE